MRAGFTVTYETGPRDVTITLPDFFAWSRWSGKPVEAATQGTIEDWVYLLWWAEIRTKATDLPFEEYAASIVDVEPRKVEAPKATPKKRGNGSNAN